MVSNTAFAIAKLFVGGWFKRMEFGDDVMSLSVDTLGHFLSLCGLYHRGKGRMSLCRGHFFSHSSIPWGWEIGAGGW